MKDIQLQFEGFLKTPCLWKNKDVFGLEQFEIKTTSIAFNQQIETKLRLGKYVERFVSFELRNTENIEIISENIQIQENKITLGELDCIISRKKQPIHLEIIYKFYLYDTSIGTTEIDHCIGPNRKDSLVEKLTKLKEKQLPLLYSNQCKQYLKTIPLESDHIEQQVYFKAQLFLPYKEQNINLKQLNSDCIAGFYIQKKELEQFANCKFYIPTKKDWLLIPHTNVSWLDINQFRHTSNEYLERSFSPMCWIKTSKGAIQKFFLVWWI